TTTLVGKRVTKIMRDSSRQAKYRPGQSWSLDNSTSNQILVVGGFIFSDYHVGHWIMVLATRDWSLDVDIYSDHLVGRCTSYQIAWVLPAKLYSGHDDFGRWIVALATRYWSMNAFSKIILL
ncbi:Hypothetical predicted protein, partial [Olea europaea subsp. europaea]